MSKSVMYVIKNSSGNYFTQNGERSYVTHRPTRGWTFDIDKANCFGTRNGARSALRAAFPNEPGTSIVAVDVAVSITEKRQTVAA